MHFVFITRHTKLNRACNYCPIFSKRRRSIMVRIYYDADANLDLIQQKRIAVIGYGSQGHAHALNLHESGCQVVVGLPAGSKSRAKAEADGLRVMTPADAAAQADVIMILIPDE